MFPAGHRRQADVREGAHAVGHAVHLRRGAAHQAPHPAQRPVLAALPLAAFQLHHQVLLPQRGPDQEGGGVLHRPLREGPAGVLPHHRQGQLLHAVHEEQNGTRALCVFMAGVQVCILLILFYFFPSFQAYYLLSRAPYEIRGSIKKFGISKLLDSGVYKAAYPLHDVRACDPQMHACPPPLPVGRGASSFCWLLSVPVQRQVPGAGLPQREVPALPGVGQSQELLQDAAARPDQVTATVAIVSWKRVIRLLSSC